MLLQSPPIPPPWLKGALDGHEDAFTNAGHDDDDAQNHDKDEDDDDVSLVPSVAPGAPQPTLHHLQPLPLRLLLRYLLTHLHDYNDENDDEKQETTVFLTRLLAPA